MKIEVEISDMDYEKLIAWLAEKNCWSGTPKPAEVIGGFIGDLIDGEQTGGSDERTMAQEYFARRWER